jgi:zinc transporter
MDKRFTLRIRAIPASIGKIRKKGTDLTHRLIPIAAFDILSDGTARKVTDEWPSPKPGQNALWRWLHFDRTDPGFGIWSSQHLPAAARIGLLQAETRPQSEVIGEGLLINLRGMNFNPGQEIDDMVALRLWVDKGLVITTRQRRIFAFDTLRQEVESGKAASTPAGFVVRIADLLTARIETASAEREDQTDAVEEELLDDHPDAIGTGELQISRLARSVIKLRRYISPQRDALTRLAGSDTNLIGETERDDLSHLANRTTRLVEELDNMRERLSSLRAHTDSLHAARLAHNGFVLSVVAAVFLPLGFLTGLFGVNIAGMPGTDWPWAFAAFSGAMILLGLGLWVLFRWLKWF